MAKLSIIRIVYVTVGSKIVFRFKLGQSRVYYRTNTHTIGVLEPFIFLLTFLPAYAPCTGTRLFVTFNTLFSNAFLFNRADNVLLEFAISLLCTFRRLDILCPSYRLSYSRFRKRFVQCS